MKKVIISQGTTAKSSLTKALEGFSEELSSIKNQKKILIAADLKVPQGNPCTINPITIGTVIEFLKKKFQIEKILILPMAIKGINQRKTIKSLGIWDYVERKGAEWVFYDQISLEKGFLDIKDQKNIPDNQKNERSEDQIVPLKHGLDNIDSFIILSQIKTDPLLGSWHSLANLPYLIGSKPRWNKDLYEKKLEKIEPKEIVDQEKNGEKSDFINQWFSWVKKILEKCPIAFVINDLSNILVGNGPYIQTQTKAMELNQYIISDDIYAADFATFQHLGIDIEENFIFNSIQNREKILSEKIEIKEKNIDIEKASGIEKPNLTKLSIKNPQKIIIPGLKLFLGNLSESLHYSLLEFLYQLESLFYKDGFNLGDWRLIAGQNPPEPYNEKESEKAKKNCTFIVYGDSTIKSIEDYSFRKIIKKKEALEGDDLERKILQKYADYRKKINEVEENFELTVNEIIKEKEDPKDRKLTKLEEELEKSLKIAKYKYKMKKYRIKHTAKHKIRNLKNKIPKIYPNKNIIYIEGDPPLGFDPFVPLVKFWKKRHIPTLRYFYHSLQTFYDFPKYNKKFIKYRWKSFKAKIKKEFEEKYEPKEPEIDKKIDEVKNQRDEKLERLKSRYKNEKEQIEKDYKLKMEKIRKNKETEHNHKEED